MKTEEQIRKMYHAFQVMSHIETNTKEVDSLNYAGAGILAWVLDFENTNIDKDFQKTINKVLKSIQEMVEGAEEAWKNSKK